MRRGDIGGEAANAVAALEREALALGDFLGILRSEQDALTGRRVDEIASLVGRKTALLETLSRHSRAREHRLVSDGYNADPAGMQGWLAGFIEFPAVAAAWKKVSDLARAAREQNEVNGWLVSLQLQRTQRQYAFLNRAANNDPTYSANGLARMEIRRASIGEA